MSRYGTSRPSGPLAGAAPLGELPRAEARRSSAASRADAAPRTTTRGAGRSRRRYAGPLRPQMAGGSSVRAGRPAARAGRRCAGRPLAGRWPACCGLGRGLFHGGAAPGATRGAPPDRPAAATTDTRQGPSAPSGASTARRTRQRGPGGRRGPSRATYPRRLPRRRPRYGAIVSVDGAGGHAALSHPGQTSARPWTGRGDTCCSTTPTSWTRRRVRALLLRHRRRALRRGRRCSRRPARAAAARRARAPRARPRP